MPHPLTPLDRYVRSLAAIMNQYTSGSHNKSTLGPLAGCPSDLPCHKDCGIDVLSPSNATTITASHPLVQSRTFCIPLFLSGVLNGGRYFEAGWSKGSPIVLSLQLQDKARACFIDQGGDSASGSQMTLTRYEVTHCSLMAETIQMSESVTNSYAQLLSSLGGSQRAMHGISFIQNAIPSNLSNADTQINLPVRHRSTLGMIHAIQANTVMSSIAHPSLSLRKALKLSSFQYQYGGHHFPPQPITNNIATLEEPTWHETYAHTLKLFTSLDSRVYENQILSGPGVTSGATNFVAGTKTGAGLDDCRAYFPNRSTDNFCYFALCTSLSNFPSDSENLNSGLDLTSSSVPIRLTMRVTTGSSAEHSLQTWVLYNKILTVTDSGQFIVSE